MTRIASAPPKNDQNSNSLAKRTEQIRLANQPQLTSGNSEGTLVARDERTDLPFRLPLSLVLRLARAQFE